MSEPKMYPDWESAQEALDRGETVRIEMEPFKIDPALVQLALDLQAKERMEEWHKLQEKRERRRLFMSLMRQPDMRLLYKALWHLKWDKGVDWRAIQQIEMERYGTFGDCWLMIADRWLVTTLQANKLDLSTDDFLAFRLHDETDPFCECSDCREALMCHLSCKAYYVTLMEREQGAA